MEPAQTTPRRELPGLVVLLGVVFAGIDVARERLADWAARADADGPPAGLVALPPTRIRARALLIGLAVTLPPRARAATARLRGGVGGALRVGRFLARPLLALGPVRAAARAGVDLRSRAAATVAVIAAMGEREAARYQRTAALAAQEVTEELLARVGNAAGVREVLVEQSAGLATEALGEVRRQADHADALVEAAARSLLPWRRRQRRPSPGKDGQPRTPEGAASDGAGQR